MIYDAAPLWLSLKLAAMTTICLLLVGIPVAFLLVQTKIKGKFLLEAIISLPLVLPPTVLGFYWLLAFSPNSWMGQWLNEYLGLQLIFSFSGLLAASIVYSLPFMVQPIQAGLTNLPPSLTEAAYTMGKTKWQTLWYVLLPNIKPALLTGIVLSFAHTIGEFGVVLMIGGKLPGETLVASIAIYDQVELLQYEQAHFYAVVLLATSFIILSVLYYTNKKR